MRFICLAIVSCGMSVCKYGDISYNNRFFFRGEREGEGERDRRRDGSERRRKGGERRFLVEFVVSSCGFDNTGMFTQQLED